MKNYYKDKIDEVEQNSLLKLDTARNKLKGDVRNKISEVKEKIANVTEAQEFIRGIYESKIVLKEETMLAIDGVFANFLEGIGKEMRSKPSTGSGIIVNNSTPIQEIQKLRDEIESLKRTYRSEIFKMNINSRSLFKWSVKNQKINLSVKSLCEAVSYFYEQYLNIIAS